MSNDLVQKILQDVQSLSLESLDLEDFLESLEEYKEGISQSLEGLGDDVATGAAAGVAGGAVLAGAGAGGIHRAKKAAGTLAKKAAVGVAAVTALGGGALGLHKYVSKQPEATEAHKDVAKEGDKHMAKGEASEEAHEAADHFHAAQNAVDHLHHEGVLDEKSYGFFSGMINHAKTSWGHVKGIVKHIRR